MNHTTSTILPDVIVIPIYSRTWQDAVREIVESLWHADRLPFVDPAVDALMENEVKGTTELSEEVSAPRATLAGFDGLALGVGVFRRNGDCRDRGCGRIVLLSVSGSSFSKEHTALQDRIEKEVSRGVLTARLLAAETPQEAIACFPNCAGGYLTCFPSLFAPLISRPVFAVT